MFQSRLFILPKVGFPSCGRCMWLRCAYLSAAFCKCGAHGGIFFQYPPLGKYFNFSRNHNSISFSQAHIRAAIYTYVLACISVGIPFANLTVERLGSTMPPQCSASLPEGPTRCMCRSFVCEHSRDCTGTVVR